MSTKSDQLGFFWNKSEIGESRMEGKFLVRKTGTGRAHIWSNIDQDSKCRMWSTGGLNKKKYQVVRTATQGVCQLCLKKNRGF